jgi:hypothetical protein
MKSFGKIAIISTIIGALIVPTAASAKSYNSHHGPLHKVSGYTKKSGKHVAPYKRTKANHTKSDNLYLP